MHGNDKIGKKKNIHTNIDTHTCSDRKENKVLYHCSEKRLILTKRIKEGFRRQDTWKASWRKKDLEGSEYRQVWIEKDLEEKENIMVMFRRHASCYLVWLETMFIWKWGLKRSPGQEIRTFCTCEIRYFSMIFCWPWELRFQMKEASCFISWLMKNVQVDFGVEAYDEDWGTNWKAIK